MINVDYIRTFVLLLLAFALFPAAVSGLAAMGVTGSRADFAKGAVVGLMVGYIALAYSKQVTKPTVMAKPAFVLPPASIAKPEVSARSLEPIATG